MKTGKKITRLQAWDFRNAHEAFQIMVIHLLLIESKTQAMKGVSAHDGQQLPGKAIFY